MIYTPHTIEVFLKRWNKTPHHQLEATARFQGYCWNCKTPSESNYPDNLCPYCGWATMEWS